MKNTINISNNVITVITITRNRPQLLVRAIKSVKEQTITGVIHYIVIDDCPSTLEMLNSEFVEDDSIIWKYCGRNDLVSAGPQRLSILRNEAIMDIDTEFFCFLDDDNEFYPNHLEQLLEFARTENCDAVHSYREILYRDGSPYLEELSPWGRTIEQRAEKYQELLKYGIATPGSNIWRDRFGITVDTNVWLIRTSLMKKIEIPVDYSEEDYRNVIPEDTKMMLAMQSNNVEVKTNKKVTVKYYLGGYSNGFGETEGTVEWTF